MQASFVRGQMLYSRGRFAEAEAELRRGLTESPGDPHALGLLSLAIVQQKRHDEALKMAQLAIGQGPDEPFPHYALSIVHLKREELLKAMSAIKEALRLDSFDADYWQILAGIHLARSEFADALEAAKQGLAVDAEHGGCQNLKATALTQLGRHDEARESIKGQLQRDPDDAMTHANQGWAHLHQNQTKQAAVHFREALRLDPELEFAKLGMLNALRARNPIFRVLLAYFLWMSRLSSGARWGVIIGAVFLSRILRQTAKSYPALQIWIVPVLVLYFLFIFLTWTGPALSNLLLRLDRYGRYLLSDEEIRASNYVGIALLLAVGFGIYAAVFRSMAGVFAAAFFLMMIIPLAGTFSDSRKSARKALGIYTGVLFVLGGLGVVLFALEIEAFLWPMILFLLGFVIFGWVANLLAMRKPT